MSEVNKENDFSGINKERIQPFNTPTSSGTEAGHRDSGNRVRRKKLTSKLNGLEEDLNVGLGLSSTSPIARDP